ncbi:MAG: hypothetical protein R3C03_08175 [Pirellulaceae bacterium]
MFATGFVDGIEKRFARAARWACVFMVMSVALASVSAQDHPEQMHDINPNMPQPMRLSQEAVEDAGIRRYESEHLVLYSDIENAETIQEFMDVFEQAIPQWASYFGVKDKKLEFWRISGFVMVDQDRFRRAGCTLPQMPRIETGYNLGFHFWIVPQPGNYYTRHLLLHEGTHSFMQWFLGGSGPPWYSEGMAELLALHQWRDGKLTLGYQPRSANEVEYWGRPKAIRTAREKNKLLRLDQLFENTGFQFHDVEMYSWAWAACNFLSTHPVAKKAFGKLFDDAADTSPRFSLAIKRALRSDWEDIERDWRLYLEELTYGSTGAHSGIDVAEMQPSKENQRIASVAANKSWQSTGVQVQRGSSIIMSASGRFQIAVDPEPVFSEAGGISVRYYEGHPLGKLMYAVLKSDGSVSNGFPVGLGGTINVEDDGYLLLRVNENPVEMNDNEGELQVEISLDRSHEGKR